MKISPVIGLVVAAHVLVIGLLLVQPGCASQPKPASSSSATTTPTNPPTSSSATTSAQPAGVPDPAFNAGLSTDPNPAPGVRAAPTRPTTHFTPPPGQSSLPPADTFTGIDPSLPPATATAPTLPATVGTTTYKVERGDNPSRIAKKLGITTEALMAANPGLNPSRLQIGQTLQVPAGANAAAIDPVASTAPKTNTTTPAAIIGGTSYTVVNGDNLTKIAQRHGVTIGALRRANNLTSDTLRIGQKLVIPAPGTSAAPAASAPAPSTAGLSSTTATGGSHTIEAGDTLGVLARRYGTTVAAIQAANPGINPSRLRIGQSIVIPGATGATSPAPTGTPTPASASSGHVSPEQLNQMLQGVPASEDDAPILEQTPALAPTP